MDGTCNYFYMCMYIVEPMSTIHSSTIGLALFMQRMRNDVLFLANGEC